MRIDDLNRTPASLGTEKTDPAAQKPGLEKDAKSVAASDQADISQLAHALSVRDPQRLEQLRLEVQSGNYSVSADAVANAIIQQHLKD